MHLKFVVSQKFERAKEIGKIILSIFILHMRTIAHVRVFKESSLIRDDCSHDYRRRRRQCGGHCGCSM